MARQECDTSTGNPEFPSMPTQDRISPTATVALTAVADSDPAWRARAEAEPAARGAGGVGTLASAGAHGTAVVL